MSEEARLRAVRRRLSGLGPDSVEVGLPVRIKGVISGQHIMRGRITSIGPGGYHLVWGRSTTGYVQWGGFAARNIEEDQ